LPRRRMSNRDRLDRLRAEREIEEKEKEEKRKAAAAKKAAGGTRSRSTRKKAAPAARMKVVWAVCRANGDVVETFPYPQKAEAEAAADRFTQGPRRRHPEAREGADGAVGAVRAAVQTHDPPFESRTEPPLVVAARRARVERPRRVPEPAAANAAVWRVGLAMPRLRRSDPLPGRERLLLGCCCVTNAPAGTSRVSHTLPPTTARSPIVTLPEDRRAGVDGHAVLEDRVPRDALDRVPVLVEGEALRPSVTPW
jgi:hypothetical protein